jgi:TetR/AcrR family transcriptional regulator, transcriptional repressor of bet genes
MRTVRTSFEKVRRQDLVEAAYLTFLEYGLEGMTMARIGERAGMSHGIVNYYFKSKDELLSTVVRKSNFLILQAAAQLLRQAATPRERISAVITANFPDKLFTPEIARAWVSYYAAIGRKPQFERLQTAIDRRLASNLIHALRHLTTPERARTTAFNIAVLIDGLWLRHAKSGDTVTSAEAIRLIESFVDKQLADP